MAGRDLEAIEAVERLGENADPKLATLLKNNSVRVGGELYAYNTGIGLVKQEKVQKEERASKEYKYREETQHSSKRPAQGTSRAYGFSDRYRPQYSSTSGRSTARADTGHRAEVRTFKKHKNES